MAKVRFRGTKTARRQLGRDFRRISRAGSERSREICEFIIAEIAANPASPFDELHEQHRTGGPHLKDSYELEPAPDGDGWLITAGQRYWVFVEFGTRKMKAQPHVRPAIELARQRFGL